jgi:hypothetical protein
VQVEPLEHVRLRAAWEAPGDGAVADADGDAMLAVGGVEMRRIVIPIEDGDRDAQEAANDRMSEDTAMPVAA